MTEFTVVDPRETDAQRALHAYLSEIADRLAAANIGPQEATSVAEYHAPAGGFVVGTLQGETIACGAFRALATGGTGGAAGAGGPTTAEIKRMWVHPDHRGRGVGAALLADLEGRCRAAGYARVCLDTNETLTSAIGLYERSGYRRVERFNDNPDATHFFAKRL